MVANLNEVLHAVLEDDSLSWSVGTDAAKAPEMIWWADGRAKLLVVPNLVSEQWGIDPKSVR